MNKRNDHYRQLPGLDDAWPVKSVELTTESKRVVISLEHLVIGSSSHWSI